MNKSFKALRVSSPEPNQARLETLHLEDLTTGDVTVQVHYSSINYKDALAGTGRGKILKQFPLTPGIDAAGIVLETASPQFSPGQKVLITGCGIGENFDGGYAEILRVKSESVVPLPEGLTLKESMILGTAGFTAALALQRMQTNGQTPNLGPILITGASGGVGSFAVQIFAQNGYEVHAVSGKPDAHDTLKSWGAKQTLTPEQLNLGRHPLESVRYGGAVDNVGGELLAKILAHTQLWGNVASIGLAQSAELHTTVMPFILRGVSLLGTSSNNTPKATRRHIWDQLASAWKPRHLKEVVSKTVTLEGLTPAFEDLLHRRTRGRILVEIAGGTKK